MYTVRNASQASTPGSESNRRVINVSGTRLYPTDEMQVEELTSDVLKGIRSGDLRVHRDNGAIVTEETLQKRGLVIEEETRTTLTSNVDGRVRKKETMLRLVEQAPEGGSEEAATSEDPAPEAEEDTGDSTEAGILQTLKEMEAIDEDVETSSDMNARPLRKLIDEYGAGVWPDGFFEEESRVTVQRAIDEANSSE